MACAKFLDIFKLDAEENTLDYLCKIERENAPILSVSLNQRVPMVAYSTEESLDILWFNFETGQIRRVATDFNTIGAYQVKFHRKKLYAYLTSGKLLIYDYSSKHAMYLTIPSLPGVGKPNIFDISFSHKYVLIGSTLNQIVYTIPIEHFRKNKKSTKTYANLSNL